MSLTVRTGSSRICLIDINASAAPAFSVSDFKLQLELRRLGCEMVLNFQVHCRPSALFPMSQWSRVEVNGIRVSSKYRLDLEADCGTEMHAQATHGVFICYQRRTQNSKTALKLRTAFLTFLLQRYNCSLHPVSILRTYKHVHHNPQSCFARGRLILRRIDHAQAVSIVRDSVF